MKIKPFRGTHDQLPEDRAKHLSVEQCARFVAPLYGFEEISTPIFEYLDVFLHTLGDTSDVVNKEMFTLKDRHDDALALRPEGTAGVMRAILSHKLQNTAPHKYLYIGPMFRYERPQAGRTRQFHQVGVEHIGEAHPLSDAEVIAFGYRFLKALQVRGEITLELNTLGDTVSRNHYRAALVSFLEKYKSDLSEDSLMRLEKNPLRILDSKDSGDQKILTSAPRLQDHLTDDARQFFEAVVEGIQQLDIPFKLNPHLVRGLDYYGHTAFEFKSSDLGAQSTVLAGGRYDGLSEQMGGPHLPSVGWAAGIERLVMLSDLSSPAPARVAIVPLGQAAEQRAWTLAEELRQKGLSIHLAYEGSLKSRMKKANKIGAIAALIMGEEEMKANTVTFKDFASGEQKVIPFSQIEETVKKLDS